MNTKVLVGAFAGGIILFFSALSYAEDAATVNTVKVDAVAAQRLARKESCFRCHHVSKKKEGPSYQSVAYKYRGDAGAADKIIAHITAGTDRVKLSDGHMEDHKMARTKDMNQIRNLVAWILAQ
jgi:cytochrome c